MSDKNELAHVKPGDTLYLEGGDRTWGGKRVIPYAVFAVERLTATQIVVKNQYGREARIRIKDGVLVGGNSFCRARVPTPEMVAEQVKAVQVRKAQDKVQDKIFSMSKLVGMRHQQDDFWLAMGRAIEIFEREEQAKTSASEATKPQ